MSEQATASETPPPEYQKCVGTLAIVPTEGMLGDVGTGADFDTREITARLERLEATLDGIEAAILSGNASKQTSRCRCSLRRSWRQSWSASVERKRIRVAEKMERLCLRLMTWCNEVSAWCSRSMAYFTNVQAKLTDDPAHRARLMARAAEERRDAERFKEAAMYVRKCVKNPDIFEESKLRELRPTL